MTRTRDVHGISQYLAGRHHPEVCGNLNPRTLVNLQSPPGLRTFPLVFPEVLTPASLPVSNLSLEAANFLPRNLILVAENLN